MEEEVMLLIRNTLLLLLCVSCISSIEDNKCGRKTWSVLVDDGHNYRQELRIDSCIDLINDEIVLPTKSIDSIINGIKSKSNDFKSWDYYKVGELELMLVRYKNVNYGKKGLKVFKFLITTGDFNEDRSSSFLYNMKHGLLVKKVRKGFKVFDEYRRVDNSFYDSLTVLLREDEFFFQEPFPLGKEKLKSPVY